MDYPLVATHIPHTWHWQLRQLCRETGKSQDEIVCAAISQYLGITELPSVQVLNHRIESLEQQFNQLTASYEITR